MNVQIKSHVTDAVLFEGEYESLKDCVVAAVEARAYLADADLADANLADADLADADLAGANLARANLAGADLARANLADADLAGADLARANLADADLADADLARANLAGADLARANLADADLADADLAGANLADADLARANLAGANLARAYLAGADLARANLADADLADANLADADLADADLAGAYLARANLADAYLADARNVPETNGSESAQVPEPADRKERQRQRALKFRERNPDVPVIEQLDAKILAAVTNGGGHFDMSTWHKCKTTHCRAGWAITLAGEAGKVLEAKYGPQRAGTYIYRASTGHVPHFFASTEHALEDLKRCAEEAT